MKFNFLFIGLLLSFYSVNCLELLETTEKKEKKDTVGEVAFLDVSQTKGSEKKVSGDVSTGALSKQQKIEFVDVDTAKTEAKATVEKKQETGALEVFTPAETPKVKAEAVASSTKQESTTIDLGIEQKPASSEKKVEKVDFVDLGADSSVSKKAEVTPTAAKSEKVEFIDVSSDKKPEVNEGLKKADTKAKAPEFLDLSKESTSAKVTEEKKPASAPLGKVAFVELTEGLSKTAAEKTQFVDSGSKSSEVTSGESTTKGKDAVEFLDMKTTSQENVSKEAPTKKKSSSFFSFFSRSQDADTGKASTKTTNSVEFLETGDKPKASTKVTGSEEKETGKLSKQEISLFDGADSADSSSPVVLITGITGAVGSELAKQLLSSSSSSKIYGLLRNEKQTSEVEQISSKIKVVVGDLNDPIRISDVIQEIKPTVVYHLAEQNEFSVFRLSNQQSAFQYNFYGTYNLLESLKRANLLSTKFFYAGSSHEYADSTACSSTALTETSPTTPKSVYGLSKLSGEILALQYFQNLGLPVYAGRFFTVVGKGTSNDIDDYCKEIASIELGIKDQPELLINSDITTVRDVIDVKDAVQAIQLIMKKGKAGEVYNIGTGKPITTKTILRTLVTSSTKASSIKAKQVASSSSQALRGTATNPANVCQVADISLLTRTTGFSIQYPLTTSIEESLSFWRKELKSNAK